MKLAKDCFHRVRIAEIVTSTPTISGDLSALFGALNASLGQLFEPSL
jgi:hypothetical protein